MDKKRGFSEKAHNYRNGEKKSGTAGNIGHASATNGRIVLSPAKPGSIPRQKIRTAIRNLAEERDTRGDKARSRS